MKDDPVRGSQSPVYQSYSNLSVLSDTSPVKMLDMHTDTYEENLSLWNKLDKLEAKWGSG